MVVSFAKDTVESHNYLDPTDDNARTVEFDVCPGPNLELFVSYGSGWSQRIGKLESLENSRGYSRYAHINTDTIEVSEKVTTGWRLDSYGKKTGGWNQDYEFITQDTSRGDLGTIVEPVRILELVKSDYKNKVHKNVLEDFINEDQESRDEKYKKLSVYPEPSGSLQETRSVKNLDTFIAEIEASTLLECPEKCKPYSHHATLDMSSASAPPQILGDAAPLFIKARFPIEKGPFQFGQNERKDVNPEGFTYEHVLSNSFLFGPTGYKGIPALNSGRNIMFVNFTCVKDPYENKKKRSKLLLLDGNDFFDIAFDRFRCFDTPGADCNTSYVMEVVTTIMLYIVGYLAFRATVYIIDHEPPQKCVSIIQTVENEVDDIDRT